MQTPQKSTTVAMEPGFALISALAQSPEGKREHGEPLGRGMSFVPEPDPQETPAPRETWPWTALSRGFEPCLKEHGGSGQLRYWDLAAILSPEPGGTLGQGSRSGPQPRPAGAAALCDKEGCCIANE